MSDLIVRLRTPAGMTRHSVPPGTPLAALPGLLGLPPGTAVSLSPSGAPPLAGASVAAAGVTHGAMVYAKVLYPSSNQRSLSTPCARAHHSPVS
jgi:hypothetical protein